MAGGPGLSKNQEFVTFNPNKEELFTMQNNASFGPMLDSENVDSDVKVSSFKNSSASQAALDHSSDRENELDVRNSPLQSAGKHTVSSKD